MEGTEYQQERKRSVLVGTRVPCIQLGGSSETLRLIGVKGPRVLTSE